MAVNSKPYRILYDPSKTFRRGAEFSKTDFLESLSGKVWSRGTVVLDIETGEKFYVVGIKMLRLEE